MAKTAQEKNAARKLFYKLAESESLKVGVPASFKGQFTKKQDLIKKKKLWGLNINILTEIPHSNLTLKQLSPVTVTFEE